METYPILGLSDYGCRISHTEPFASCSLVVSMWLMVVAAALWLRPSFPQFLNCSTSSSSCPSLRPKFFFLPALPLLFQNSESPDKLSFLSLCRSPLCLSVCSVSCYVRITNFPPCFLTCSHKFKESSNISGLNRSSSPRLRFRIISECKTSSHSAFLLQHRHSCVFVCACRPFHMCYSLECTAANLGTKDAAENGQLSL